MHIIGGQPQTPHTDQWFLITYSYTVKPWISARALIKNSELYKPIIGLKAPKYSNIGINNYL